MLFRSNTLIISLREAKCKPKFSFFEKSLSRQRFPVALRGGELQDSIQSYGAQLPHALDSAAMKKMPASKIKNEK